MYRIYDLVQFGPIIEEKDRWTMLKKIKIKLKKNKLEELTLITRYVINLIKNKIIK